MIRRVDFMQAQQGLRRAAAGYVAAMIDGTVREENRAIARLEEAAEKFVNTKKKAR